MLGRHCHRARGALHQTAAHAPKAGVVPPAGKVFNNKGELGHGVRHPHLDWRFWRRRAPDYSAPIRSRLHAWRVTHNEKEFQVFRYDPTVDAQARMVTYKVNLDECGPMVLDALIKIQEEQDSTLLFDRSCREGICKSCAMNINGKNTLACLCRIEKDGAPTKITPLSETAIIKDLVPDIHGLYFL